MTTTARRPPAVLILVDNDGVRAHLAAALAAHDRKMRRDGVSLPPAITALVAGLSASGSQRQPNSPTEAAPGEAARMSALVDYRTAADTLAVSVRTVGRLVADGALPAVNVRGRRRIRSADLLAYVERLGQATGVSAIARRAALGRIVEDAAKELAAHG